MLNENQIAALRAGVQRAKENYRSFDMNTWAALDDESPCGTVGCLAFEICAANGVPLEEMVLTDTCKIDGEYLDPRQINAKEPKRQFYVEDKALEIIGVGWGLRDLFYQTRWPEDLRQKFYSLPVYSMERISVLEEVVERWIEENR